MAQVGAGVEEFEVEDLEDSSSDYREMMERLRHCYGEKAKLANKNFCAGVTSTAIGSAIGGFGGSILGNAIGNMGGSILFQQLGFVLGTSLGGGVVLGGILGYLVFSMINEDTHPYDKAFAKKSFLGGAFLGLGSSLVGPIIGEFSPGPSVVAGMITAAGVDFSGLMVNGCLKNSEETPAHTPAPRARV